MENVFWENGNFTQPQLQMEGHVYFHLASRNTEKIVFTDGILYN